MSEDFRFNPASFRRLLQVSKQDNVPLPGGVTDGLIVGVAGTATLRMANGGLVLNVPLQQGYHPLQVIEVHTGGTADGIFAGYFDD